MLLTPAAAQAAYKVELRAFPARHTGACPKRINFRGTITLPKPGKVQYRFIRSDGARTPPRTLIFKRKGSRPVSSSWNVGKPGAGRHTGWQRIEIVRPLHLLSRPARFTLTCRLLQLQRSGPDLAIQFGVSHLMNLNRSIYVRYKDRNIGNRIARRHKVRFSMRDSRGHAVRLRNASIHVDHVLPRTMPVTGSRYLYAPSSLPKGRYRLCATTDATRVVREINELNNTRCIPVTIRRAGGGY